MRRRDISICLRPLAPIEEKRRNIRQKDLVTSEWVNSPRVPLQVQKDPVRHAVGTSQTVEKRIAEIIDVHHEEQDADRPHEVGGLAESPGIFL